MKYSYKTKLDPGTFNFVVFPPFDKQVYNQFVVNQLAFNSTVVLRVTCNMQNGGSAVWMKMMGFDKIKGKQGDTNKVGPDIRG